MRSGEGKRTLLAACIGLVSTHMLAIAKRTWMLILELCQIVHILVNDDPEIILGLVRADVGGGKHLRHGGEVRSGLGKECG
jgi:hypothetical protein